MIPYTRPEAPPILDPDDVVILDVTLPPERVLDAVRHADTTGRIVVIGEPNSPTFRDRLREAIDAGRALPLGPPRIDPEALRRFAAEVSPPESPPNRAMRRKAEQQKRRGGQ